MNNLTEAEIQALEIALFVRLEQMEKKPAFIALRYRRLDEVAYVSLN